MKSVAFDYAAVSSAADLQFFSRFDVLVTGAILPADQLRILQSGSTRLLLYVWSSAHYPNEGSQADRIWEQTIRNHAASWLLSPQPIGGGAAAFPKTAFWYDFGNPSLSSTLAASIRATIEKSGYAGVFLDTLGFESLPQDLQHEFRSRHPWIDYDQCQAQFLSKLRAALGPQAILFTNQGYRKPACFLPHSDLDLIENSSTLINSDGSTMFRPWLKKSSEWESIEVPMSKLVIPAARLYPNTQLVHINYVRGDKNICERAVSYSFACAKLWGHLSFVAPPGVQHAIRDNIYFTDLGNPLADYEEDVNAGAAWRRFQNGVVALNSSHQEYRIASLGLSLPDPPRGYVFPGRY